MPKMVSSDSHVQEPREIYNDLPKEFRAGLPDVKFGDAPPGGSDARLRRLDQIEDGVEAEILFPNYTMTLLGLDDIEPQNVRKDRFNEKEKIRVAQRILWTITEKFAYCKQTWYFSRPLKK